MIDHSTPPANDSVNHCTDLAAFLRILHQDGDLFEVRSIKCPVRVGGSFLSTHSGYFNDVDKAAKAIKRLEKLRPPAIYVTFNPIDPALLARAVNRIEPKASATTTKKDVMRRQWLFVDIDSKRPSGISATDEELREAENVSNTVLLSMLEDDWPMPLQGMSGNGRYLLWRIDLPNDTDGESLVKQLLQAMASQFNTDGAEVDTSTFDASRICKVLGTIARKGDDTDDRPHRQSWFIPPTGKMQVVPRDLLQSFADSLPKAETQSSSSADPLAIKRASKYLAKMDAAVAGSKGHNALFAAACALVVGFDLHPEVAYSLLENEYNPRCEPPWNDAELRHKVESAMKAEGERGKLLRRNKLPVGKEWEPNLLTMSDVESRPVQWLWKNRLAAGRISLLVGVPGCGKSFVTCDMAARVSTGTQWPDGSPCEQGSVLFITAEDDPGDTIRPRLDAHHADVSKIHLLVGSKRTEADGKESEAIFTLADLPILNDALKRIPDCKLIVIDPIGSFLGGGTDSYKDNEVRSVLAPVSAIAERTGAAVLIIAHRRKGSAGNADDTAMGSRAFTGLARAVWHLSKDLENPGRRLLLPGKNNLAAELDGLAFSISGDPAAVQWEEDFVEMSADDAMAKERNSERDQGRKSSAVEDAIQWLKGILSAGKMPAKEVKSFANRDGIAWRTVERASEPERLGVIKEPDEFGGPWSWRLPDLPVSANSVQCPPDKYLAETEDTWRTLAESDIPLIDIKGGSSD